MLISLRKLCIIAIIGVFSTAPVFGESAPVYDVDSLPQQSDDIGGQEQDMMPPPPGQEGTFVPAQQQTHEPSIQPEVTAMPSALAPAASVPSASTSASMTMEQRMRRVEQEVNKIQGKELGNRTESLQTQVQTLRGQVEQLTHQLQQLQEQQKGLALDVDKRLSDKSARVTKSADASSDMGISTSPMADTSASDDTTQALKASRKSAAKLAAKSSSKTATKTDDTATTEAASGNTASVLDQPNVAEEQQIYQTAYNLIKAKKYNDAVNTLQKMLQKYPSGQFASNAHYWLGELYGLLGKNEQALAEFLLVVKTYPDSPRISDAQLKVGLIYAAQSKWPDARTVFKKVINRYPGTSSARLASEQLKQLKQSGH